MALENEAVKPLWATKTNVVGPAFGSATEDPCGSRSRPKVPHFPVPAYTLQSML